MGVLSDTTLSGLKISILRGSFPSITIGNTTIPAPPSGINLYGLLLYTNDSQSCIFYSLSSNGNTFMLIWNGWANKWYKFTGSALS